MELLDFLTPEASGLSNIAEGGFQYLTPKVSNESMNVVSVINHDEFYLSMNSN